MGKAARSTYVLRGLYEVTGHEVRLTLIISEVEFARDLMQQTCFFPAGSFPQKDFAARIKDYLWAVAYCDSLPGIPADLTRSFLSDLNASLLRIGLRENLFYLAGKRGCVVIFRGYKKHG